VVLPDDIAPPSTDLLALELAGVPNAGRAGVDDGAGGCERGPVPGVDAGRIRSDRRAGSPSGFGSAVGDFVGDAAGAGAADATVGVG
jgi:hypothetical protein